MAILVVMSLADLLVSLQLILILLLYISKIKDDFCINRSHFLFFIKIVNQFLNFYWLNFILY